MRENSVNSRVKKFLSYYKPYLWSFNVCFLIPQIKKLRRELRGLEDEIEVLLDAYEELSVKKTRKGKPYLEICE